MNNKGIFWFIGIVVVAIIGFSFFMKKNDNPATVPTPASNFEGETVPEANDETLNPQIEDLGDDDATVDPSDGDSLDVETDTANSDAGSTGVGSESMSEMQAKIDTLKSRLGETRVKVSQEFADTIASLDADLAQLENQLAVSNELTEDKKQEFMGDVSQRLQDIEQKLEVISEATEAGQVTE